MKISILSMSAKKKKIGHDMFPYLGMRWPQTERRKFGFWSHGLDTSH